MTASASLGVVASVAISTMGVISSRTGVVQGSRPLSANLAKTSRSENIPATISCSSTTATAPTALSIIVRMASPTVASKDTVAGPSSHHASKLIYGQDSFPCESARLLLLAGGSQVQVEQPGGKGG